MSDSDLQLLERYTREHAEDAFAEIVRRHLDLVFSAALRQVRSPQLAEEVAQSAFTDLARQAHQLAPDTVLSAWLYQVTRRTAVDVVRREARRQAREQIAQELHAMNATTADWTHIEPLLDEAMQALEAPDRTAVVLRYFESKSLREVGQTLGTTEEAARKRVTRAVEHLRELLTKRGVTVGASGLVALISANAVQAAPAGLAVTISTAASVAGTTIATTATATATATKAITMTALQKTLIAAALVAAVGTSVYEARQASRLRDKNQTLQQQQAPLNEQIQQLQRERDDALKRLAAVAAKPTPRLPAPSMQITVPPAAPPEELRSTNLYSRIKDGVRLTAKQVEPYLNAHGRNSASLLAAYRTTGDPALLEEAMQKYPGDPLVALEAASREGVSPEVQRKWLEAFKQAAPDNALPNYLLARNYFKAGQTDQAVQELVAASGKSQVQDYFVDRMSDDEEAYLAAGYSAAEAKALGPEQLVLMPDRGDLKQLAYDIVELAKSYQRAGDQASAQAALQMAVQLGQRGQVGGPGQITIDKFLGFAMETLALNAMNPSTPYGDSGQTVRDRLNQIAQQKAALKDLVLQSEPYRQTLADQDWLGFSDRMKALGEEAALRWVLSRYGHK